MEDPVARQLLCALLPPWGSPSGDEALATFTAVLESTVAPLAYIHSNVAQQFCKSIKQHFPGIAAQANMSIRQAPKASQETEAGQLEVEVYFPFDPYRLFGSHIFLLGIYRSWKDDEFDEESTQSGQQ